jgi:hypothetical protein
MEYHKLAPGPEPAIAEEKKVPIGMFVGSKLSCTKATWGYLTSVSVHLPLFLVSLDFYQPFI